MISGQPEYMLVFAIANDGTLGRSEYFSFRNTNITNTIVGAGFLIGALLVSFSKEKNELFVRRPMGVINLLLAARVQFAETTFR